MEKTDSEACVLASVLLNGTAAGIKESEILKILNTIGIKGSNWAKYFEQYFAENSLEEMIEAACAVGAASAAPGQAAPSAEANKEEENKEEEKEEEEEDEAFGFGGLF